LQFEWSGDASSQVRLVQNAAGADEPHSSQPELWEIDGREVDLNAQYKPGGQLRCVQSRANDAARKKEPIFGRPMNMAAFEANRNYLWAPKRNLEPAAPQPAPESAMNTMPVPEPGEFVPDDPVKRRPRMSRVARKALKASEKLGTSSAAVAERQASPHESAVTAAPGSRTARHSQPRLSVIGFFRRQSATSAPVLGLTAGNGSGAEAAASSVGAAGLDCGRRESALVVSSYSQEGQKHRYPKQEVSAHALDDREPGEQPELVWM
jgi:hypothetical protein